MVTPADGAVILLGTAILAVSVISYREPSVNGLERLASVALLAESPLLLFLIIGEVFGVVPAGYVLGSLSVVLATILVGAAAYIYGKRTRGVA